MPGENRPMKIILTGSVAFDYLMTFPGYFREHILPDRLDTISLSFLVDSMVRLRGGVAPNIAYTMALLGERPYIYAAVGEDFQEYRSWLESIGLDTSGLRVIPGEYTASFFVTTDRSHSQIASFYPGAMGRSAELSLSQLELSESRLVVISPSDPAAMTKYTEQAKDLGISYVFDPSQQIVRMSADEICSGVLGSMAVFSNDYEWALIENKTDLKPAQILANTPDPQQSFIVVTRGDKGASIYSQQREFHIPVIPPQRIVDPTGVGDAFRGGFFTGYSHRLDLELCAQMGVLAATYCLENRGPQGHSYTPSEFLDRFRSHFDDHGKLDAVLKQDEILAG
jgi:adenosine kinase